jgi:hypothetical protein
MNTIADRRLLNHRISHAGLRRPEEVVAWLGAVQAQEYEPAKWGLGLRMRDGAPNADVERAFAQGRILRTHVMRPTWHFVTPADIRWMLALTGPRVHRAMASYRRALELDERTLRRGTAVFERALRDRRCLTRLELRERLRRARLAVQGVRLAHLAMYAELEGVICSGPRRGKQFTYALLAERAPDARRLDRDQALGELARRFFRSHGPATTRDFVWWSGLITADARRAIDIARARREEIDGLVCWTVGEARRGPTRDRPAHLLPIYDEYLVAYRDREWVSHGPAVITTSSGARVNFQHAVVVAGKVAGTWRLGTDTRAADIQATLLRRPGARDRRALADAADRYARFQGADTPPGVAARWASPAARPR